MKILKPLLVLITTIALVGCGDSAKFWLDNPLDEPIKVTLDGKTYDLSAKSGVNIRLKSGEHSLSYNDQTLGFNLLNESKGGLINPTLSNYYIYYQVYLDHKQLPTEQEQKAELARAIEATGSGAVLINGHALVDGPFMHSDALIVENMGGENGWTVGVDKALSADSKIKRGSRSTTVGKLFREADLIAFLQAEYSLDISITPEDYKKVERRFADLPRTIAPLNYKHECAQVNTHIAQQNRYLDVLQSSGHTVEELVGAYNDFLKALSTYEIELGCAENSKFIEPLATESLEQDMVWSNYYRQSAAMANHHVFLIIKRDGSAQALEQIPTN